MAIGIIFLCAIDVLLIALIGWEFGRARAMRLDIEKLYDLVSQLAREGATMRKGMAGVEKKIDGIAQSQEEAAEAIAKQVEKKWDSGLQNMLNWNPFDKGESEGG